MYYLELELASGDAVELLLEGAIVDVSGNVADEKTHI
jgi:hypothetical protein